MFESTTIPLLQEVVNFAQARHGVLVGNMANLDTPGYRTRDLSVDVFQDRLKEIDGITEVYSAVDLVKALNRAFHEGKKEAYTIPDSVSNVTQQLFVIEGSEELEKFLSYDYSKARVMARVKADAGLSVYKQMPDIDDATHEIFGDAESITTTGRLYSHQRMEEYVVTNQIRSFILAFIVEW